MTVSRTFTVLTTVVALIAYAISALAADEPGIEATSIEELGSSDQFKQLDIVNIDRAEFVDNRPAMLEGHIEMVLIPRDQKDDQVTIKADRARWIYRSEEGTMPDEVVVEGNVTVVQGDNRLTTEQATWYQTANRIVCEGNPVARLEQTTIRAERIVYYLADGRIVAEKVTGTWRFEESASAGTNEGDDAS